MRTRILAVLMIAILAVSPIYPAAADQKLSPDFLKPAEAYLQALRACSADILSRGAASDCAVSQHDISAKTSAAASTPGEKAVFADLEDWDKELSLYGLWLIAQHFGPLTSINNDEIAKAESDLRRQVDVCSAELGKALQKKVMPEKNQCHDLLNSSSPTASSSPAPARNSPAANPQPANAPALAAAPKNSKKDQAAAARPQATAGKADYEYAGVGELVSGGTELRFPVMHVHGGMTPSGCYGYLYISRDSVRYEVLGPDKFKDHSFQRSRADVVKVSDPGFLRKFPNDLAVQFRNGQTETFDHVDTKEVEKDRKAPLFGKYLRPREPLMLAFSNFDQALAAAGRAPAPPQPNLARNNFPAQASPAPRTQAQPQIQIPLRSTDWGPRPDATGRWTVFATPQNPQGQLDSIDIYVDPECMFQAPVTFDQPLPTGTLSWSPQQNRGVLQVFWKELDGTPAKAVCGVSGYQFRHTDPLF